MGPELPAPIPPPHAITPIECLMIVAVMGLMVLIPIVRMLTRHQRNMAELIHGKAASQNADNAMAEELSQLRTLVHRQAIQIDDLQAKLTSTAESTQIEHRLTNN